MRSGLIFEICTSFDISEMYVDRLPITLNRCLSILRDILTPEAFSSTSSLPPPNDHIFVLRCLAKVPLDKWDKVFGPEEMGVIMRGLESGDDSVRKAVSEIL